MADISDIVFDSLHPASLAGFWADVLDRYAIREYDALETRRLARLGFTPETATSTRITL